MKRIYEKLLEDHFAHNSQMALVCGPRQVGKTTISRHLMNSYTFSKYFNWDIAADKLQILSGTVEAILEGKGASPSLDSLIVLDEIHKLKDWKNYLKGLYDQSQDSCDLLITGSAALDIFQKSGDSLMGRYFLYRIHPLTLGEFRKTDLSLFSPPANCDQKETLNNLLKFGGFPEPFTKASPRFQVKWQKLRQQQLIYEEVRSLESIHNLAQLDLLGTLLIQQAGQLCNYTALSVKVKVSTPTIIRWISVLQQVYFCFQISPWSTNITRSLLKEPKVYLWDWSMVDDLGRRLENFVASHLLKAVHFWSDMGMGDFDLHFVRTKDQMEVDFLVTRNHIPWILIEVKSSSNNALNSGLYKVKEMLQCPFAFQLVFDLPANEQAAQWLMENLMNERPMKQPLILSAEAFLSMLP